MKRTGYSLIEVIIVIGIIMVIGITVSTNYWGARKNQELKSNVETFADVVRTAHIFARGQRDDTQWGVVSEDGHTYQLVSGDPLSYTTIDDYKLAKNITFESTFTIWFERGTGFTNTPTIVILENPNGQKLSADIATTGVVEIKRP